MPRRMSRHTPKTALGAAISERRGTRRQADIAEEAELSQGTLSAIERGGKPNVTTALRLAKWLGWTVERVIEAASQPA